MIRLVPLAIGLLALTPLRGTSEEPPLREKPPYEGMLTGKDKKQVERWEQQIAELEKAGKRSEAAEVAEKVRTLRQRVQGTDHWLVKDAEVRLADLQRKLTPEQREQIVEASRLNIKFERFYGQGKYPQALAACRRNLMLLRKARGEEHPPRRYGLTNVE